MKLAKFTHVFKGKSNFLLSNMLQEENACNIKILLTTILLLDILCVLGIANLEHLQHNEWISHILSSSIFSARERRQAKISTFNFLLSAMFN